MPTLHGTCVQISGMGVLLLGAPGSGKSDLALRLIAPFGTSGALLVADDQVIVELVEGKLMARAPKTIAGRIEVRGVGIIAVPDCVETELRLAVRLDVGADTAGARLPDFSRQVVTYCSVSIPELHIDPFTASAVAKIHAMVHALCAGGFSGEIRK